MARLKVAGVTILTCPDSSGVSKLLGGRIQGEKILILPTGKAAAKPARKPARRKRTARAKRSSARKR